LEAEAQIMNRTKYCLYLSICLVGLAGPSQAADTLAQQEAELLQAVRKQPVADAYSLARLAFVREKRGHYQQATAAWNLVKRLHYGKLPPNESSAPTHSYGQIADFYTARLRRKQWLAAHPPRLSNALRRKLAQAKSYALNHTLHGEGHVQMSIRADLDGDLIDEIFAAGTKNSLSKRNEPFMCIAKWDGSGYKVVWRAEGKHKPRMFPFGYRIADEDGDGCKEIMCSFQPETDNDATLLFNGTDAMMTWLSN
jgi:hypothetical protein